MLITSFSLFIYLLFICIESIFESKKELFINLHGSHSIEEIQGIEGQSNIFWYIRVHDRSHSPNKLQKSVNLREDLKINKIFLKKSKRRQPPPHLSCSLSLLYMASSMKKQALMHVLHKLPPISPLYNF